MIEKEKRRDVPRFGSPLDLLMLNFYHKDVEDERSFLKSVLLFRNLLDSQIEKISSILQKRRFSKGQIIFTEGDPAKNLHILRQGRVKIFRLSPDGKEQILHFINEGEVFGEVAAFLADTYPASAQALKDSVILNMSIESFHHLIKNDPNIAMNMLAILCFRLKEFVHLIDSLSLKDVSQRLSTYLLFAGKNEDKVELEIKKVELASFLGTTPETLSRILSKMTKENLITVRKKVIHIKNSKELIRIALGERSLYF